MIISPSTLYNVIHILRYALLAHGLTDFLLYALYTNYVRCVFKKTICPAPLYSPFIYHIVYYYSVDNIDIKVTIVTTLVIAVGHFLETKVTQTV